MKGTNYRTCQSITAVVEFQIQLQKGFEPIVWLRLLLPLKMKEERNSLHFVYTTRKIVRARATQCFNLKNSNSSDKTQNIDIYWYFHSIVCLTITGCRSACNLNLVMTSKCQNFKLKPKPFKYLFSTSIFTNALLNCFVL